MTIFCRLKINTNVYTVNNILCFLFMCWSVEASVAMTVAWTAGAVYAYKKWQSKFLYIPLIYFTLMELLQAVSYPVINQCGLPANEILTVLAYIHIAFQPIFFNLIMMAFIPERIVKKIFPWVVSICFVSTVIFLLRLYPFSWSPMCEVGNYLCGTPLCTVSWNWHIAWQVPFNTLFSNIPVYIVPVLVLPFLYGSWKAGLFSLFAGPLLATLLTDNPNEAPAIWCLFSIALLILVMNTRLREALKVEHFFLWKKEKKVQKKIGNMKKKTKK